MIYLSKMSRLFDRNLTKNPVEISLETDLDGLLKWIEKNIEGKLNHKLKDNMIYFYFENPNEAFLFKLIWS